jgi:hypothetical protein
MVFRITKPCMICMQVTLHLLCIWNNVFINDIISKLDTYGFPTPTSLLTFWIESRSWRGVLDQILRDKVYKWLAKGRWFSLSTPFSSTIKTHRHGITEIFLKVASNTINQTKHIKRPKARRAWNIINMSSVMLVMRGFNWIYTLMT